MSEQRWLALILALFLILGVTYAVTTPIFEASDELWHYPMVEQLANGRPLPVQVFDPAEAGLWKQEASQPPLYYYLAAGLTFWIDTSDLALVRWENPHVNNGIITEDGNINLTIRDPAWNPWQGSLLAVRIVRLFSVLLGLATVYLTYLIGKEVMPADPEIYLVATAVNAFIPMFLFISGSVNNDNLAIPLASWALLLMIRMVSRGHAIREAGHYWWHWLLIGTVIGLAILTKEGTFGLFPIALGTAFISQWQAASADPAIWAKEQAKGVRPYLLLLARAIGIVLWLMVPVLLIAGWWYWRNIELYGDFLGWNAFVAVLGQRAHPASLAQLWSERHGFMMSFWGLFGGVNVPMAAWIYTVLNSLLTVAVVGFGWYVLQLLRPWLASPVWNSFNGHRWLNHLFAWVVRHFGLIVCGLFALGVVMGLIQWATTTWSSQGRLVFTALSALSVLLVLGLMGWLPTGRFRTAVGGGLALFLLLVAAVAPFVWIRPSYQPPLYAAANQPVATTFGEAIALVGYEVDRTAVGPGDGVWLTLNWQVLAPMARNWSIFVHLNDPVLERPIAQRDMFHGQGLRPTALLQPGEQLVTRHWVVVPPTAVAPADLALTVGLYDMVTGERLPIGQSDHPVEANAVWLETVRLTAVAGELPNPISVKFEQGFELVAYDIQPRRLAAGDSFDLTLYWRMDAATMADYTFFAQLVSPDTTRWASQDLAVPTSDWAVGTVQPVPLQLTVRAETPPDVYSLIVGLYTMPAPGEFERLQRITADGRLTDDFLELTLVRVD